MSRVVAENKATKNPTRRSAARSSLRRCLCMVTGILARNSGRCLRFLLLVGRQARLIPLLESICRQLARITLLLHFSGRDSHGV